MLLTRTLSERSRELKEKKYPRKLLKVHIIAKVSLVIRGRKLQKYNEFYKFNHIVSESIAVYCHFNIIIGILMEISRLDADRFVQLFIYILLEIEENEVVDARHRITEPL